jgi:hypothetical protein
MYRSQRGGHRVCIVASRPWDGAQRGSHAVGIGLSPGVAASVVWPTWWAVSTWGITPRILALHLAGVDGVRRAHGMRAGMVGAWGVAPCTRAPERWSALWDDHGRRAGGRGGH